MAPEIQFYHVSDVLTKTTLYTLNTDTGRVTWLDEDGKIDGVTYTRSEWQAYLGMTDDIPHAKNDWVRVE